MEGWGVEQIRMTFPLDSGLQRRCLGGGFGSKPDGLESWLWHSPAAWPQASESTSLKLCPPHLQNRAVTLPGPRVLGWMQRDCLCRGLGRRPGGGSYHHHHSWHDAPTPVFADRCVLTTAPQPPPLWSGCFLCPRCLPSHLQKKRGNPLSK